MAGVKRIAASRSGKQEPNWGPGGAQAEQEHGGAASMMKYIVYFVLGGCVKVSKCYPHCDITRSRVSLLLTTAR